ncbi:MAG: restriction endonuclease subunit S, partial [Candidatus Cloacimonetes bacterium]|nr:restriction endonuclease subunit S [Candidatus Cloacimonadota bacterium]
MQTKINNSTIHNQQPELPTDWKWVRLGEVCVINPRRPKNFTRFPESLTTFIPMSSVNGKSGAIIKPEVVPYFKVARGYTYFEENDVLFAKITPCMQNGKHLIARNLIDRVGFGTTEFHVLRTKDEILPEWIHFFIRQPLFLKEATSYFTGAVGQQRVPKEFLSNYIIPLPPLYEQKRIAKKIQELMQEIDKSRNACEKQLEAVKALPSSYLREVFESEEAKKWERKRLGEVCDIFSGSSAPQDEKYFVNGKYPFVRVQDLGRYSKTDNLHKIKDYINDTAIYELKLKEANKGTIL